MTTKYLFLSLLALGVMGVGMSRADNKTSSRPLAPQSQNEVVFQVPSADRPDNKEKGRAKEPISFSELFSNEISLAVPLPEVVILVVMVNFFALFNKARWILVASYLACCKWVFFSNYSAIVKQSGPIAQAVTWFFVGCGILTLIFWWMNRFEKTG